MQTEEEHLNRPAVTSYRRQLDRKKHLMPQLDNNTNQRKDLLSASLAARIPIVEGCTDPPRPKTEETKYASCLLSPREAVGDSVRTGDILADTDTHTGTIAGFQRKTQHSASARRTSHDDSDYSHLHGGDIEGAYTRRVDVNDKENHLPLPAHVTTEPSVSCMWRKTEDDNKQGHSELGLQSQRSLHHDGDDLTCVFQPTSARQLLKRKRYRRTSGPDSTGSPGKGYVPSWLQDSEQHMDIRKRLSKESVESDTFKLHKSWSVSDLRDVGHIAAPSTAARINNSNDINQNTMAKQHQHIEKEYLRLRKQMQMSNDPNTDTETIESSRSSVKSVATIDDSLSSVKPLLMENNRAIVESDGLDMNHFQKHIYNVKQSSKRYRKLLKPSEPRFRQGQRKFPTRFKPIYER